MPVQLNSAQKAAIDRLETQIETAFTSGTEYPPGNNVVAKLDQYDQPIMVNGQDQTSIYKPKIKGPFKALVAAMMAAIESWNTPTLGNGWLSYDGGASYNNPGYYRTLLGQVQLRGMIRSGTVSYTADGIAFTLPPGYRPSKNLIFAAIGTDTTAQVRIDPNGNVYITPPTINTWVSLEGITFRADQ